MNLRLLFPRLLALGFALSISASVMAQRSEAESRQTNTTFEANGTKRLETDVSVPTSVIEVRARTVRNAVPGFDRLLLGAIESHLGARYRYNRTGPEAFDCSGFVWRSFQDIGLNFQRGPARSYWATFSAPPKEEQFKFGTLVFFSGLTHVGIVVDEKGFYHSARHGGVYVGTPLRARELQFSSV